MVFLNYVIAYTPSSVCQQQGMILPIPALMPAHTGPGILHRR